jgi:hypothetical protein
VLLLNNPYVDLLAIQKLTGKNIALGIAGNPTASTGVRLGKGVLPLT